MSTTPKRKVGLMAATAAIAVFLIGVSAIALSIMASQQQVIEEKADRIDIIAMPKVFESTRIVRGLERLARDGEAILWVATAEERDARRARLVSTGGDTALLGSPDMREMVASALATLDENLVDLKARGLKARPDAVARWEPVAQSLLNAGVVMGAEAVDSALAESDAIIAAAQAARQSLMVAGAIIAAALSLAMALIYLVFARPLKRLAASLRLAEEGHDLHAGSEFIHELQVLNEAAVALARSHNDLIEMRRQLDHLAHSDDLTGLANRRMFQERAAQMLEVGKRYGHPGSIIVFDLDHFKSINDRFGHEGGDLVLRTLGAYLRSVARTVDLVARVGGEEFAIMLPHTPVGVAELVARRLCEGVAGLRTAVGDDPAFQFTASFGVAEGLASDADLAALMHRADNALYRAKANGRNRVEVAT